MPKAYVRFLVPLAGLILAGVVRAEVATVVVEPRAVGVTHSIGATIEAVRQVTLAAQVSGRIVALNADAGDRVEKGAILVRIDAAEATQAVAGAEATIAQAEANLLNAQAAYDRTARLIERRFVSPAALDEAKAARDAAFAQLRAARAGRGRAGAVQAYTSLASPLAGLVAERHVERGDMAQPGRPLLTVFDPTAMRAIVDVPQFRFEHAAGAVPAARVELPGSGRWFDAAMVTVLPAADPRTHTVRVRVDLPPDAIGLVPGMYARVHFSTGEAPRVAVPAGAILRRGEITAVYVVDGNGGFALRQIRAGEALAGGGVEVLAGLAGGERVALDAVQAGVAVRAAKSAGRSQ